MNRAIFMDRDGVINKWEHGDKDVPESWYVLSWDDFEFLPGAKEAICRLLKDTDYSVMVISNQSGIGRGFVDYSTVFRIFDRMRDEILAELGVDMTETPFWSHRFDFYFCPHEPNLGCACRKPAPGLLYKAAIEHDIDLSRSWMIGDSDSDIWAANNAGVSKLIKVIDSGRYNELESMQEGSHVALGAPEMYCYFVPHLFQAVEFILDLEEAEKC